MVFVLVQMFMHSSLHFDSFSWNLSAVAWLTRVSTAAWIWLSWFLLSISEIVVSLMYFQRSVAGTLSSSITTINSHYPNFVSWGTPAGTPAHSERQSWPSLTRCLHKERKLVIQEITASWMSYVLSFLTNIPCSMRSKAFLKTKRTTLTKAPLPSVTQVHQMHKQMKGSMSYSPIQMRS